MLRNPGRSNSRIDQWAGAVVRRIRILQCQNALSISVLLVFLFSALQLSVSFAQDVIVRAQLSASTITRDESVTLTITASGIDAELDASSLETDFDVVGRSSSRQISTVINSNNRMVNTSVVTWALELVPKNVGVFTVPAVMVGDYETQLLTLTVNEVPSGANRDVFVEAVVDTTEPWVQSQVIMTLRVFQGIDIVDGGLDVPAADDLVVEPLGDDTRTSEVRDGRKYSVTERRFAVFPQRSGSITIEPVTLSVSVPAEPDRVRGFFSPTRKLTRRTEPLTLNVQARPPAGVAWWLPAKKLVLQSQWQGDPKAARVDQPLTRTVVLSAEGVLESQLPTISIPAVDGLSLYAEEPTVGKTVGPSGLVAEQQINWALIPQRTGKLTLPAISVEWFNTLTGQNETAELPAETIIVLGGGSAAGSDVASNPLAESGANPQGIDTGSDALASLAEPASDADNSIELPGSSNDALVPTPETGVSDRDISIPADNATLEQMTSLQTTVDLWRLLFFIAAGLWLLTAVAWWMSRGTLATRQVAVRRGKASPMSDQVNALYLQMAPMRKIDSACQAGDLLEIKGALLAWARRHWPDDAPTTLDGIQARLPEGDARAKLVKLQAALYSRLESSDSLPELRRELASLSNDLLYASKKFKTDDPDGLVNTSSDNNGTLSSRGSSRLPQL